MYRKGELRAEGVDGCRPLLVSSYDDVEHQNAIRPNKLPAMSFRYRSYVSSVPFSCSADPEERKYLS